MLNKLKQLWDKIKTFFLSEKNLKILLWTLVVLALIIGLIQWRKIDKVEEYNKTMEKGIAKRSYVDSLQNVNTLQSDTLRWQQTLLSNRFDTLSYLEKLHMQEWINQRQWFINYKNEENEKINNSTNNVSERELNRIISNLPELK